MNALFKPGCSKRYGITQEERYGHSLGLEPRTFQSATDAKAYAQRLANAFDGLTFTVVELLPLEAVASESNTGSLFDSVSERAGT